MAVKTVRWGSGGGRWEDSSWWDGTSVAAAALREHSSDLSLHKDTSMDLSPEHREGFIQCDEEFFLPVMNIYNL